ncbi:MAG: hypothetical protein ACLVKO_03310 [Dysgonomonas sp.]
MSSKTQAYIIAVVMILTNCFLSCNQTENRQNRELLAKAQEIVDNQSDSALVLLDGVRHPEKMKEEDYMTYLVTKVQAKAKSRKDITGDTIVFEAKKYFEEKNDDPHMIALANLYAGRVYEERGTDNKALACMLTASEYASQTDDTELKGIVEYRVGRGYSEYMFYSKALERFKKSERYYSTLKGKEANYVSVLSHLGTMYSFTFQQDSAEYYLKKSSALAEKLGLKHWILRNNVNMNVCYNYSGRYKEALECTAEAMKLNNNPDNLEALKINIGRANSYIGLNNLDSAEYYASLVVTKIETVDNATKTAIYAQLVEIEKKKGNYKKALEYERNNLENAYDLMSKAGKDYVSSQDKESKLEIKDRELKISKDKAKDYSRIIVVVVLSLVIVALIASIVIIKLRNKGKLQQLAIERQRNEALRQKLTIEQQETENLRQRLIIEEQERINKEEKEKSKAMEVKMENMNFANRLFHSIAAKLLVLENEIAAIAQAYSMKDSKSKGYAIIEDKIKGIRDDVGSFREKQALAYLKEKKLDASVIESLKGGDHVYLAMAMCGYEFKDIAATLGVKTHALQMRKGRLREKLLNAGLSEQDIAGLSDQI